MLLKLGSQTGSFAGEISDLSGVKANECYQCGKCSAGCSVGEFISDSPTRIIRLIQLNQKNAALTSRTPYICASCNICSERCPMGIDIPKLMETLRIIAKNENIKPAVKSVGNFSRSFLNSVKNNGRLFEFGMTLGFNLSNFTPFKNAELAPGMLLKRKLSLLPQKSRKPKVKDIFAKVQAFYKHAAPTELK